MKILCANVFIFNLTLATATFFQQGPLILIAQMPVIRHSKASALPNSITITGKIIAISPGYCGYVCFGGTVKIKLVKPIAGYHYPYVFVVTACLSKADTSRVVNVMASRLRQREDDCYYSNVSNLIDSQTIPFYKLSEAETNKLEWDEDRRK